MATVREDSIPHVVRTAHEPRQRGSWNTRLSRVEQVNSNIRLLRLSLEGNGPPLRHLPGQYVDLQIPDVPTIGGFTITSPPQTALPVAARPEHGPYIELAIQNSPNNPPAAFLWQPPPSILDAPMVVRIGGNFAYPPLTFSRQECESIDRAVFVAGGVGINPIMSMISAMDLAGTGRTGGMPKTVRVLYGSKRIQKRNDDNTTAPEEVLFEKRLRSLADKWAGRKDVDYQYKFFETGGGTAEACQDTEDWYQKRRISHDDLFQALGPVAQRKTTVVYICGLPAMTDEFVKLLQGAEGMEERRVLCEKWW